MTWLKYCDYYQETELVCITDLIFAWLEFSKLQIVPLNKNFDHNKDKA